MFIVTRRLSVSRVLEHWWATILLRLIRALCHIRSLTLFSFSIYFPFCFRSLNYFRYSQCSRQERFVPRKCYRASGLHINHQKKRNSSVAFNVAFFLSSIIRTLRLSVLDLDFGLQCSCNRSFHLYIWVVEPIWFGPGKNSLERYYSF